jgi:phosphatidylethanolamine/phosphatidyl-N-methylethanolamine N-methyltransferase
LTYRSVSSRAAPSPAGNIPVPRAGLSASDVVEAYRRWAGVYDTLFGAVSTWGRRAAVEAVNALPGRRVLEAGVGTGLALPRYLPTKRVVGIDLSAAMLKHARARVAGQRIATVETLREMDAEATDFADGEFDIAVAMFVASVVPNPRRLLEEMRRVVRPGGHILFVNHFAAERGLRWWVERTMAPGSRALGWHPDFKFAALLTPEELAEATLRPMPPFGLFTLVHLPR